MNFNYRRLLTFVAAAGTLCSVALASATNQGTRPLVLEVGTIDTAQLPNLISDAGATINPESHYVLRLDGPMTPQRMNALTDAGVVVGDYLPVHSYIVNLSGAEMQAVSQLDFVTWVGAFQSDWKIAPGIGERDYATVERQQIAADGNVVVCITLFEGADEAAAIRTLEGVDGLSVQRRDVIAGNSTITAILPAEQLSTLASIKFVQFVEETGEMTLRNSTTRWIIQSNVLNATPLYDNGVTGLGQVVGVLDSRVDVNHCSFSDSAPIGPSHRKIIAYNTSLGAASHGTHCAGTAVGDNGTNGDLRGIAYDAKMVFDTTPSFNESAVRSALQLHHSQGARLHTNSWGDDGTTSYNSMCRGFDDFIYTAEDSLVCLAVTNTSSLRNPENAKNLLAVGASQDTPSQGSHCTAGVGPTADNRRKPEIYAPGCSTISASSNTTCGTRSLTGTSMACPAITGLGALVRQYYVDGYYPTGTAVPANGFTPTSALLKATLINSAVDMTGIGGYPSNLEGWGRALADDALHFAGDTRTLVVHDVRIDEGIQTNQMDEYFVTVTSPEQLKITLVWNDPAASASTGSGQAWINDLDLEVVSPSGQTYLGNWFVGGESATGGAKDPRNNVEQAHFSSAQAGLWTVRVVGAEVNDGIGLRQSYALVVSGAVVPDLPAISLSVPNRPEVVLPGAPVTIQATITPGEENVVGGDLFYRFDGGSYSSVPLQNVGGDTWEASIPGADCADSPEYYVAAAGDGGTSVTSPSDAPASAYSYIVGEDIVRVLNEMEVDEGWTVGAPGDSATTGVWNRMNPQATDAQPEDDTTQNGTQCWVTDGFAGASLGANDVDDGATTLLSPIVDLSTAIDPVVSYNRWYSNDQGGSPNADVFVIDISNDGGTTWTNVETVGPSGPGTSGGWTPTSFRPADILPLTGQMRMRFVASDEGNGSIVEAAIDDFRIDDFECVDVPGCTADLTGDGVVDAGDLNIVLSDWGCTGGACAGDLNNDGLVDAGDLNIVLSDWGCTE